MLTVSDSIVSDNTAVAGGGGVLNYDFATTMLTGSTVMGNSAGVLAVCTISTAAR